MRVTSSPSSGDHKQVTFNENDAIKLIVDGTCNLCGWQGKVTLFSTTPEQIDACETICPNCGQVDFNTRFAADTSKWVGIAGASA